MKKKYNELINLYDELIEHTQKISKLLLLEDNAHEVEKAVLSRGDLIKLMDEIILSSKFSDEEKLCLNGYVKKFKNIELENMSLIEKKYSSLKKEINQNKINTKMASAYKVKQEPSAVIFDVRE